MRKRIIFPCSLMVAVFWLLSTSPFAARPLEPLVYTVRFPTPESHLAEIEVVFPADKRAAIELMMPIWSPGFYRVEDYASRVQSFSARAADSQSLAVEQPSKNRWRITTNGAARVIVTYKLLCNGRSVTTNWVGEDLLVLNGAA